jgi:hypothetical protein
MEVVEHNCCAKIFDRDCDFGVVPTIQFSDMVESNTHFVTNEADASDDIHNCITMPIVPLDVEETDEFGIVLNSQY